MNSSNLSITLNNALWSFQKWQSGNGSSFDDIIVGGGHYIILTKSGIMHIRLDFMGEEAGLAEKVTKSRANEGGQRSQLAKSDFDCGQTLKSNLMH